MSRPSLDAAQRQRLDKMGKTAKKSMPGLVLAVLLAASWLVARNPPPVQKRPPSAAPGLTVEVARLQAREYQVMVQSYGAVQPRTRSMLKAQVSGQVVSINPDLRDGGFFERGEVLLNIDARDYEADVSIAAAEVLSAKQQLAEERARAAQARRDWERLGDDGDAPALVLREPQLLAAEARLLSAEARLDKAALSLERAAIVAPYDGRVLRKEVDVGQVVNVGNELALVYAIDYVEIRLPIRNRDLPFLTLPERYRDGGGAAPLRALIYSEWNPETPRIGRVTRAEGAIDENARQLHVVAQIEDPFSAPVVAEGGGGQPAPFPIKIGQYVTAELAGRVIEDAMVIPNGAIYQSSYVYVAAASVLQRREIDIAWQNDSEALIADGLREGDRLVLTPLGQVTSGTRVRVSDEVHRPAKGAKRVADAAPSRSSERRIKP